MPLIFSTSYFCLNVAFVNDSTYHQKIQIRKQFAKAIFRRKIIIVNIPVPKPITIILPEAYLASLFRGN